MSERQPTAPLLPPARVFGNPHWQLAKRMHRLPV
jgi:hypothetical protein